MKSKKLTVVETDAADRAAWEAAQRKTWDLAKDNGVVPADVFDATLEAILADDSRRQAIAERGQDAYRYHLASKAGYQDFCQRFRSMLDEVLVH